MGAGRGDDTGVSGEGGVVMSTGRGNDTGVSGGVADAGWKYIYPPNAREQEQLDIMISMERAGKDSMDERYIDQEILFKTEYWHVSRNRYPYEGAEQHFLIVSRPEVLDFAAVTPEMWADMQVVINKLRDEYGVTGGAFVMRFGDPALSGASLLRVHAHLIQPREGEKVRPPIGGKKTLREGLEIKENPLHFEKNKIQ